MGKLLPTGCKKKKKVPTWKKSNFLLEKVGLDDEIGHLFIVAINFTESEAIEKHYA